MTDPTPSNNTERLLMILIQEIRELRSEMKILAATLCSVVVEHRRDPSAAPPAPAPTEEPARRESLAYSRRGKR